MPAELAGVHDHEAGRAGELLGRLGRDPLGDVGIVAILGRLLLVLVVVGARSDAVLEDRVQVGLDVVGVDVLVLVLVLVARRLATGRGRLVLVVVLVDDHGDHVVVVAVAEHDLVVELVVELFLELFLVRCLDVVGVDVLVQDLVVQSRVSRSLWADSGRIIDTPGARGVPMASGRFRRRAQRLGAQPAVARRASALRSAWSRSSSGSPEWSTKRIISAIARCPACSAISRCISWPTDR